MTTLNKFDDADVQKIAATLGGSLIAGAPSANDGMLQAVARYASGGPLFTAVDSQTVQDVYGHYLGVLAEGTTMRMAYYAFQGLPETTYDSPVNNLLTGLAVLFQRKADQHGDRVLLLARGRRRHRGQRLSDRAAAPVASRRRAVTPSVRAGPHL